MGRGRGAGRAGRRRRARLRFGSRHWLVARRGDLRRGFHNKDGYVASGTRSRARPPGSAAARRMAPREQRGRSGVHRAPAVGRGGTPMIRVLIVEDDFRVAEIHRAYVQRLEGFTVVAEAHTALEALRLAEESRPDLVLLDVYLPDRSGLEVLRALHAPGRHHVDVIAITADKDVDTLREALQGGVIHYLVKPFQFSAFREKLESYVAMQARLSQVQELDQDEVDRIYGLLRSDSTVSLPKGLSSTTLALVVRAVRGATEDVSAVGPQRERDGPVECRAPTGIGLIDDPLAIVDLHPVPHRVAKERAANDRSRQGDPGRRSAGRCDREALRPHAETYILSGTQLGVRTSHHGLMRAEPDGHHPVGEVFNTCGHEIHRADEIGEKRGLRVVVDLPRRPCLLDLSRVHDRDPVGERERFLLVVGHVDEGHPETSLEDPHLDPKLLAELRVEIGKRLIDQ